jgi:hypothetical protein
MKYQQRAGVERQFSLGQVVYVGALAAMTRRGIEIGAAIKILRSIEPDFLRALWHDERHSAVLLVEGDKAPIGNDKSLQSWLTSWNDPHDNRRPIVHRGCADG